MPNRSSVSVLAYQLAPTRCASRSEWKDWQENVTYA